MSNILELEIVLIGTKPKIWRRVLVQDDLTFHELHYAIQFAMPWTDSHLYQFFEGKRRRAIGIPHEDDFEDLEDSRELILASLLKAPKDSILYLYDFGDNWEHQVTVVKVHEPEQGAKYPWVIDGAMACPPEDCGGIWGFEELLDTLKNKKSKEYKELLEWLGEEFDPKAFDKDSINEDFFVDFKEQVEFWEEHLDEYDDEDEDE